MKKFNHTFFYKRDLEKKIVMSRNIQNMKVGDNIKFFGKLYIDKKHTKEVASTIIEYKILFKSKNDILIETNNKYIFNKSNPYAVGTLQFTGKIFSSNFIIEDNIVHPYTTKLAILVHTKGTNDFRHAHGYSEYKITENGIGECKIVMELLE